jgi:hypothetical protein
MEAEINIEEIIKKVNETTPSFEGGQTLVNQIIFFKDKYRCNGIVKSRGSSEMTIKKIDALLARYTTNNNIDKITDGFTGKEKINSGKFEKFKRDFLDILNDVQVQFNYLRK